MNVHPDRLMCGLIHQVQKAAGGHSELDVVTYISRPMWELWCDAVNMPRDSVPTEWKLHDCRRIFGSETRIVESDEFISWSCLLK